MLLSAYLRLRNILTYLLPYSTIILWLLQCFVDYHTLTMSSSHFIVMAALCNSAGHYIFALWFVCFFLLFFLA